MALYETNSMEWSTVVKPLTNFILAWHIRVVLITDNYRQILFTDNRRQIPKHRQLLFTDNKTDKYPPITTDKIPTNTTYWQQTKEFVAHLQITDKF